MYHLKVGCELTALTWASCHIGLEACLPSITFCHFRRKSKLYIKQRNSLKSPPLHCIPPFFEVKQLSSWVKTWSTLTRELLNQTRVWVNLFRAWRREWISVRKSLVKRKEKNQQSTLMMTAQGENNSASICLWYSYPFCKIWAFYVN